MRKWLSVLMLLMLVLVSASPVLADTTADVTITATGIASGGNFTVAFSVAEIHPTQATIRITVTNLEEAPLNNLPVTFLLSGLGMPTSQINWVELEHVYKVDGQEYKTPQSMSEFLAYFNLPSITDDAYGFGAGKLVKDFTINTGLNNSWGTKGILKLLINGTLYYDLSGSSWWDGSWTYRMKLTFTNAASAENLINFPVLVHLDAGDIDWTHVQNAGQDIRFIDSNDTTALDFEIENWNDTVSADIWVEVPQIDAGSNADFIYMYYGNATAADGQDPTNVWNANFVLVSHMKDDPNTSTVQDSTSSNWDGNKLAANEPIEVASQIYKGQQFDGTNDYINFGNRTVNGATVEFWKYYTSPYYVLDRRPSNGYIYLDPNVTSSAGTNYVNGVATSVCTPSVWEYVAVAGIDLNGTGNLLIGIRYNFTQPFGGYIDEVRVSNVVRSGEWIEAQYLSMTDAYITFGGEESVPANPPIGLILTQVEDYQVDASWTASEGNTNFMLRRALGDYPSSITNGELVYEGALTSASDTADDIGLELDKYTYYYRVWAQNSLGTWSDPIEGKIGGATMFLLVLVGLSLAFTVSSYIFKKGMLAFAGAAAWMITSIYCFAQYTTEWDTYFCLAFLFIALTLGCAFSPLAWRETTSAGEMPEDPDTKDMREEIEAWNKERNQYNFLYSGKRARRKGTKFQRTGEE